MERLGWPERWHGKRLYDDGGLPVHLYPFPVTADGRGPCDEGDPEYDHDIYWCNWTDCLGVEDELRFPVIDACAGCGDSECGHERYAHSPFHEGRCVAEGCNCKAWNEVVDLT